MVLDSLTDPRVLYARDGQGDIHVVLNPAGRAEHVGVISTLGGNADLAMTYDRFDHVIYFFEAQSDRTGRIKRLE
ncbi:hypothetical protein [Sorangium cellulosum]|uniref:hypothetical protein n=1 Tax=Sorangium cellulosum TaxID=56 RepID=UPI00133180C8|nr:hypothetical protein [Sorangium cellulosum]